MLKIKPIPMLATLALVAGAVVIPAAVAMASDQAPATCVPSDAWDEKVIDIAAVPGKDAVAGVPEVFHYDYQRYSWTGGPTDAAPTEVPPSDNWQPNTVNYDGAGHGTDPVGVAFPKNDKGKADWFFWTQTKVVDKPAIPGQDAVPPVAEVSHIVHREAVTCSVPTPGPTGTPGVTPTPDPTGTPSVTPTPDPTGTPSVTPTPEPTGIPGETPSPKPSETPAITPTDSRPSTDPSVTPAVTPTDPKPLDPAAASGPVLASTGQNPATILIAGSIGAALMIGGVTTILLARRGKRTESPDLE